MTPENVVIAGDCVDVMAGLDEASVDAVVTDPPYQLGFMNKAWDRNHQHEAWAQAAYRVAKPSAYLLAFGGTRTVHRMTVALEDAGWIIRDMLVWAYASGFPKSKASLKPAWEPIVMARKPGPLRMLAIDECRIEAETWRRPPSGHGGLLQQRASSFKPTPEREGDPAGRWPANVILTDPIFDGDTEGVVGGGATPAGDGRDWSEGPVHGSGGVTAFVGQKPTGQHYGDSGTYSRFFLIPKADRSDREPVLGGLATREREGTNGTNRPMRVCRECGRMKGGAPGNCQCGPTEIDEKPLRARANHHPTVKPTELMRHLVRLVTPTGGIVLDPFLGSGTTAIAAELEGFKWLGIEKEAEYVAIAEARLNGTQRGLGLDVPAPTPRVPKTHPDLSKHQPKRRAPGENWSGRWAGTDEDVA